MSTRRVVSPLWTLLWLFQCSRLWATVMTGKALRLKTEVHENSFEKTNALWTIYRAFALEKKQKMCACIELPHLKKGCVCMNDILNIMHEETWIYEQCIMYSFAWKLYYLMNELFVLYITVWRNVLHFTFLHIFFSIPVAFKYYTKKTYRIIFQTYTQTFNFN